MPNNIRDGGYLAPARCTNPPYAIAQVYQAFTNNAARIIVNKCRQELPPLYK